MKGRGAAPERAKGGLPQLGILASHPIQYQTPLYGEIARRARVRVEVAFLSDQGVRPYRDSGFGIEVSWDVDLLIGYSHHFLLCRDGRSSTYTLLRSLYTWVLEQDVIMIHGYSQPYMVAAALIAEAVGRPYLMRGDAKPAGSATGWRRTLREAVASHLVSRASACLPIGKLNSAFYTKFGARRQFWAPYSVDNARFSAVAAHGRRERNLRLCQLGLPIGQPVVVFAAKLIDLKRPFDLIEAVRLQQGHVSLLVIGDGPLREAVERRCRDLPASCVGFVNQAEIPLYYGAGDIFVLPSVREQWGLAVNEAMACGLLPVVSDQVGCAPDLVAGVGKVFPAGDVAALASCLQEATAALSDSHLGLRLATRIGAYSLGATARGIEDAVLASVA